MTEQEPIRLIHDLGAQFEHAAVAEDGRRPGLLEQLRTRLTYPNAGRTIAMVLASIALMGSIAYAITPIRGAIEDISEWVVDPGSRNEPARGSGEHGAGGKGDADQITLTGNRREARAGATVLTDAYSTLRAAVRGPLVAPGTLRDTLAATAVTPGLTDFCRLMSEKSKQETIAYASESSTLGDVKWTCEKAVALLLFREQAAGTLRSSLDTEVVAVRVVGDQATATIQPGGNGPVTSFPLVKEEGEWKIGSVATPADGDRDED